MSLASPPFHKHTMSSDSEGERIVSPHPFSTLPKDLSSALDATLASSTNHVSLLSPRIAKPTDSAPSSAMSSPPPAVSILRRESVSDKRPLKFTVATPTPVHHTPLFHPNLVKDDSEDSDDGYREDEEDGEFSDEDEDIASPIPRPAEKYPFARSTNYDKATIDGPPAPAIQPPPQRRGRGHIKVKDDRKPSKTCSRHCSPPPRSRSGSERGRLSDAGPRGARAGSPMPDVTDLSSPSDEEEPGGLGLDLLAHRRPSLAPPAVDDTPALGSSLQADKNLYHRLEESLSS